MMSSKLQRLFKRPMSGGFSVLELMISIGIVILITGISLVRYSSFNNTILLTNQAYELALDIRQAQVYGISVQAGDVGVDANRDPIGLHVAAGEQSYTLFRDDDPANGEYDDGDDGVIGEYLLDSRFEISDICADSSCGDSSAAITFQRPNFDAVMETSSDNSVSVLEIVLRAANDSFTTKTVRVESSGLISVE